MKHTQLDLSNQTVVSLSAENSVGFLEAAFRFYESGRVFAINRPDKELNELLPHVEEVTLSGPPRRGWTQLSHTPRFDDVAAQIVFTSGTEGSPKAIVLSYRNLAEVVTALNSFMGVTNEIREYIGVPVTYSFGLGRARAVAAAGGRMFLPERFSPSEIRTMLEAGEVNAVSAVPSLWRSILAMPEVIGTAGKHVRWIEIGSQFMSGEEKETMRQLFPKAKIVQHYGLTEASRSTLLDVSEGIALDSIGRPLGCAEVRITKVGAIAIRGRHIALGQLDQQGLVRPLTDETGWLVTNDRGDQRDGWLYFLGRLDDQINVSGLKVGAEALETEVAELVPGIVGRFAVTGVHDKLRGEAILVAIESSIADQQPQIEAACALALSKKGIDSSGTVQFMQTEALPRTGTDKIRRKELRSEYQLKQFRIDTSPIDQSELTGLEQSLATTWRRVVGPGVINSHRSFYDVGGDSLSSIQVGIIMEAENYSSAAVRATLEGQTLQHVARVAETTNVDQYSKRNTSAPLIDQTVRTWAINIVRGIMVVSLLLSHWGTGLFERLNIATFTESWLVLIYRMGTPGFATVFGVGIGFFMISGFSEKRQSVLRRLQTSFWLVLIGWVLLAVMKLTVTHLSGRGLTGTTVSGAFYGVLAYYMIALGTAPLWLPALARLRRPVATLLVVAPLLWLSWKIAQQTLPTERQDSLIDWFRLMTVGGYSVLKMAAITAPGIAVGYWLSKMRDTHRASRGLLLVGSTGFLTCLFSLVEIYGLEFLSDRSSPAYISLIGLTLYVFLSTFFLGVFLFVLLDWKNLNNLLRLPFQVLIVLGSLALPIYVFHQLVIPARDIFVHAGLSAGASLTVSMFAFLSFMGYSGFKIYRMYFGR